MTTHLKELTHRLDGKLINHVKGPDTIRCPGIIAQVQVVILRHQLTYLPQDGKSAITRVENTDWTWRRRKFLIIRHFVEVEVVLQEQDQPLAQELGAE